MTTNEKKLAQHNPAIERAILGAAFEDPRIASTVFETLSAEDLYNPTNQKLFDLLQKIFERDRILDVVLANDEAERSGLSRGCIGDLLEAATCGGAFGATLKKIKNDAKSRMLAAAAIKAERETEPEAAAQILREGLANLDATEVRPDGLAALNSYLDEAASSTRPDVPCPWPYMNEDVAPGQPDTLGIWSGNPGASKTLMMLQWQTYCVMRGVHVAMLSLESGLKFNMARSFAQIAGEPRLTRRGWVRDNARLVATLRARHQDTLARIGAALESPTQNDKVNYHFVLCWIRRRFEAGAQLVIVDPVSLCSSGSKDVAADDTAFLRAVKRMVGQYSTACVLVTHPTKSSTSGFAPKQALGDVSGGAVVGRLADYVLHLSLHEEKAARISVKMDTDQVFANRTLFPFKVRNGAYWRYAMHFDSRNLMVTELGRRVD